MLLVENIGEESKEVQDAKMLEGVWRRGATIEMLRSFVVSFSEIMDSDGF